MILENTPENRRVAQVAASLAIENMYLDEEFLNELVKAANGKKTYEELRQEVIKKYGIEEEME